MTRDRRSSFCRILGLSLALCGMASATLGAGAAMGTVLPDGRVYEKVTPAEKNGGNAFAGIVLDNNHIYFPSGASFLPEDPWVGSAAYYVATRGESSWSLRPGWQGQSTDIVNFSDDFSRDTIEGPAPLLPGVDTDLFRDVYVRDADGLRLVSEGTLGGNGAVDATYAGQSADGSRMLFETAEQLEPEDSGRVQGVQLYERVGDETHVIGLDSNEKPLNDSGAVLGDGASKPFFPPSGSSNAVSADGTHIFFESPDPFTFQNTQLYVRINGADTVQASASQCKRQAPNPPCGDPQPVAFQGAAKDGSKVVFTTTGQLVDDDVDESNDVYEYDLQSGGLTRLSAGAGGSVQNAEVQGVTAVSQDGRRVYFQANGPVGPGNEPGKTGLYLYDDRDGVAKLVANTSSLVLFQQGLQVPVLSASSTPDGGTLVFETPDNLTSFDSGGASQIYRYNAESNTLLCVSCNSAGIPPLSQGGFSAEIAASRGPNTPLFFPGTAGGGTRVSELVSADGSRVVFKSFDTLVPEDTNNRADIYEWHNGVVSLITLGTSKIDSRLAGISADGRDIFFVTNDRLVPQDTDSLVDLYDARIGGGLPAPPQPPAECPIEQCRSQQSPPPVLSNPGSRTFHGSGNAVPRKRASFAVAGVTKAQRTTLARTGTMTLRVSVNQAGKVSLVGRAKIGGRLRVVAQASKSARKASAVKLAVKLSKASRRALDNNGKLRVSIAVKFAGVHEPRTLNLSLRRATGGKGR